jgi:hypothetical protein
MNFKENIMEQYSGMVAEYYRMQNEFNQLVKLFVIADRNCTGDEEIYVKDIEVFKMNDGYHIKCYVTIYIKNGTMSFHSKFIIPFI